MNQRIEAEAKVSGEPLSDHERGLLRHPPNESLIPMWPDPEPPAMIPRALPYERLCSIAKAAYSADLRMSPEQAADWEFAPAISKLHRHPIAWLLPWAGVIVRRRWWDRWLLVLAAVVVVVVGLTSGVLAEWSAEDFGKVCRRSFCLSQYSWRFISDLDVSNVGS